MQSFVIEGGRPLSGTVRASGNKNGALPILAASVLASDEVRLSNVPRIRDVETMVELLADLGADVEWTGPNEVRVDSSSVEKTDLDPELAREIRASFLLAGPLLSRFGRVTVPPPGGDVIGRRRLDTHVHAFTALGAEFELNGAYELSADGLRGTRLYLDEASVMGTENAIMAAVCAEGETILGHAACEPHIQDLCRFLVSLGAKIEGIGSNVLHIEGVDRARRRRAPDRPGPHRGRELRRPRRRSPAARSSVEDVRARRPHLDRPRLPEARDRDGDHGLVRARSRRPGPARRGRSRRADPEDRERHLAGVPRRPHVDRGDRRDAGAGHDPHLREDVREQALLRGQARLDGRADHPLRPASRRRHRPGAALRRAAREPGHPRRNGDGHRGALRRGDVDDREHRPDRPRATSGSTSACAHSARASSGPSCESRGRGAHLARRRADERRDRSRGPRPSARGARGGRRLRAEARDRARRAGGRGRSRPARRSGRRSRRCSRRRRRRGGGSASSRPTRRSRWSSSKRRASRSSPRTPI